MRLAVFLALLLLSASPALADFQSLLDAARSGSLEAVRAELAGGSDPNPPDYHHGYAPLQFAAGNGHVEMTRLLLTAGADTEYRDHNGDRAIIWAAQRDQLATLRLLIDAGSPADAAEDPYGATPLMEAAKRGNAEMARVLIEAGADPNARGQVGDTPLHLAAFSDSPAIIRMLVAAGANPNVFEEVFFETPLHEAAEWAGPETLAALIEASAVIDQRDREGKTPLHVAAQRGKAGNVALLAKTWENVDAADFGGRTPVLAAITSGASFDAERLQTIMLLVEYTADIDRAFATAVGNGQPLAALRLLSRGASVDAVDADGVSALAGSVRLEGDFLFNELVARADLGRFGGEALLAAATYGRADLAKILMGRGVPVDSRDAHGATPLLMAARNGHVGTVELLLAAGAEKVPVDALGYGLEDYMRIVPEIYESRIRQRAASRAWRPTDHIEIDLEEIRARQAAIRKLLAED